MLASTIDRFDQRARERDEARGYSISKKMLGLAFFIEVLVIATSLYGAYLFATKYGSGDDTALHMMMLAPLGYAAIELARVPLAVAARIQRSWVIKILAAIGVIAAAGVTVKSMSQLGEIMFRPRLEEVQRTSRFLADGQARQALMVKLIEDADAVVAQRAEELKGAEEALTEATSQLGGLPKENCFNRTTSTPDGRVTRSRQCRPDARVAVLSDSVKRATAARAEASTKLDQARRERAALTRTTTENNVTEAQDAYKKALAESQLHSFTAMFFAKDPAQVTDAEVYEFLRIFVFVPAILVSLAATLLALASVEKVKRKSDTPELDEAGVQYILGPYAEAIVAEAKEAAERSMVEVIRKSDKDKPDLKVVG